MTEGLTKIAELFKFGRSAHSESNTAIQVSANGTTSVPPDTLAQILRARFAELHTPDTKPLHDRAVGLE